MWTDRQTDRRTDGPTDRRTGGRTTGRHDEDNSRFSQFCEKRLITDIHLLHCSSFVARIKLSLCISHIISAYARFRFSKQLWSSTISPVSPLVYSLCVYRLARLPAAFLHMTHFTLQEFQRAREVFTTMWLSGA
jgi:hypothetical protein